MNKSNLKNKSAIIGSLILGLSILGVWAGNMWHAGALIEISTIIGLIGLVGFLPFIFKFLSKFIEKAWKIFRRAVYEVFYEAKKAIEDAKNSSHRKN